MNSLSPRQALWSAIRSEESKVFPNQDGKRIGPKDLAQRIRNSLAGIGEPEPELIAKARESLTEAKAQTEYQDQKIGRLLTIISFLTAAAGALFSKIADCYPIDHATLWTPGALLIAITYLLFFIFVLSVVAGAIVSFHATRTRFVWEASRGDLSVDPNEKPTSHLFFQECVCTSPENWGGSFALTKKEQMIEAYAGYIVEAYLVNAKIADKLRLLEPAQVILGHAIRLLLVWLLLASLLFACVARAPKDDQAAAMKSGALVEGQPKAAVSSPESASGAQAAVVGQSIVVNCSPAPVPAPPRAASLAIKTTTAGKCEGSASAARSQPGVADTK